MPEFIKSVISFLVLAAAVSIIFPALYPLVTKLQSFAVEQNSPYMESVNKAIWWWDFIWIPIIVALLVLLFMATQKRRPFYRGEEY